MVLEKEIKFILTLDALKNVQRRNFNHDDQRRENSAEHSWQIIVLAQILFPYAKNKEKIDPQNFGFEFEAVGRHT